MAQQQPNDPTNLTPTRYSEKRVPQFTGGDIDPSTGNLIPGGRLQAGGNNQPAPTLEDTPAAITEAASFTPPTPATPTTRLQDYAPAPTAAPLSNNNSTRDALIAAGANAAASLAGKYFSSGSNNSGQPSGSSSSYPNAGGFGSGGGSNSGGGTNKPLDITAPGTTGPSGSSAGLDDITSGGGSSFAPPAPGGNDFSNIPSGPPADFSYLPPAAPAPAPYTPAPPAPGGGGGGGGDSNGDGGDGSGSVICTELHRQGLLIGDTFEADQTFGAMVKLHHPDVYAGYKVWARPTVALMRRSKRFTGFINWAAAPWANYMAIRQGRNGFPSIRGVVTFHVGWALCACIGAVMAAWRRSVRVTRDVLAG